MAKKKSKAQLIIEETQRTVLMLFNKWDINENKVCVTYDWIKDVLSQHRNLKRIAVEDLIIDTIVNNLPDDYFENKTMGIIENDWKKLLFLFRVKTGTIIKEAPSTFILEKIEKRYYKNNEDILDFDTKLKDLILLEKTKTYNKYLNLAMQELNEELKSEELEYFLSKSLVIKKLIENRETDLFYERKIITV